MLELADGICHLHVDTVKFALAVIDKQKYHTPDGKRKLFDFPKSIVGNRVVVVGQVVMLIKVRNAGRGEPLNLSLRKHPWARCGLRAHYGRTL